MNYLLNDEQAEFTALPNYWFDDNRQTSYKIVICDNHQPIGFFVLDDGDDKFDYTDDKSALLLRSMSINPNFQGKGYGELALLNLNEFIDTQQISSNKIVLGVNHKNIAAQKLYKKVGFIKSERTYMGIKGLQYVYELNLY
ncbi:GNAT family N-acetyltransferase [Moraxella nasicaprae]|uniref:GNAT family N-acetyltransferase n=1 Tax=Moraxella nasicaprae TaxID=2904122 RepID=A0ABY6F5I7_9GAMM|nr:GNAT family N-acetyltransferase [Moraxella nasicaprae]UXZ05314.1 GNAT family N-acetyltransferase [Moraxella nasicaprae]